MEILCISSDIGWVELLRIILKDKGHTLKSIQAFPVVIPKWFAYKVLFIDFETLIRFAGAEGKWEETVGYLIHHGGHQVVIAFNDQSASKGLFRDVIRAGAVYCFTKPDLHGLDLALEAVNTKSGAP